MIHDRIKSPHMDLIALMLSSRVVSCHMPTVEVSCCLCGRFSAVLGDISVELSDVMRVLDVECWILIHPDLGSIAQNPLILVEIDITLCKIFHHLKINYGTSIDILHFHGRNVADHQLAISLFHQRSEECCVVTIA